MKAKCRFFAVLLLIFCMITTIIAADGDTAEITDRNRRSTGGRNQRIPAQFKINAKSAILIEAGTGKWCSP